MFSAFFSNHRTAVSANETPLCFSINSPPFEYNHTIASAYFSAVFSGLGLSSNLFALVVLAKTFHHTKSRSRSSFLLFLGGLVFTDFMGLLVTGSIVVSFHITHFNWRELDPHCHFCNFMGMSMVFYGLCPLLLGAAMAVERFVGINRPFARTTNMSKSRALSTVAMVWVTAGCISLLPLGGLGSYHLQMPGSWCFLNISSKPLDMTFSLIFSLVGLLSLVVSFLLNTVSVITLLRVCCGKDGSQRRRDYEVEMMIQLILIMVIASICWCPLLIYILKTVVSSIPVNSYNVLFFLRLATCNQICDPWIYILCQESRLRCLLRRPCCRAAGSKFVTCFSGFVLRRGTRSWIPGSTSYSDVPY
ncbi:thromboxane A2 receptor-like isoform X2 [Myxocyprinus asiaticus]|uniref:thromboxane A2 receptor-like isoform X2 n=1 Tax=Myxocyprinus asiaticus TaxID=70543 RepID=UPI002221BF9B|nr:thromboxane A2 receptor-like isoform X2 [Myxocyprinus asiaticus]